MHQLTHTEYGSSKNFVIYSPAGHYKYISDAEAYLTIKRKYDAENKTYTISFISAEAPNNRWTGTWEVMLAKIDE